VFHTLQGFAKTLEAKDQYTAGHSGRVVLYTSMILDGLGRNGMDRETLLEGAAMHDIGKLCLDLSVLNSPKPLSREQVELFRSHPVRGREILEPITFLNDLIPVVYSHHEYFDGSGYPEGLKGGKIPLEARVVAVADSYDAMTSARSYRRAMKHSTAVQELAKGSGSQFDPDIVTVFLAQIENCLHDSEISRLLNHIPT
jgi:HD-GYP domain-containing protein (c-di-GMP phosphodiesterase class II)